MEVISIFGPLMFFIGIDIIANGGEATSRIIRAIRGKQ